MSQSHDNNQGDGGAPADGIPEGIPHLSVTDEGSATIARLKLPNLPEALIVATTARAVTVAIPEVRAAFVEFCVYAAAMVGRAAQGIAAGDEALDKLEEHLAKSGEVPTVPSSGSVH